MDTSQSGTKVEKNSTTVRQTTIQCLTVLCPTLDEAVGQFCILQLGWYLTSIKTRY
ncbi:hypothetical protein NIES2109_46120 [Nostoc sp. HK-01]|uniref:Uncharacterized protein n=1 Tax=Anabaenopsis circularis NIES-21 TaxID=1085406 RepID=A0A1Z4GQC9_9CYAN|nr:hypothetical protein NIES21_54310 [Anabaenopsis circularis NIES-21]BBD61777.1 hypothetical protein NIES2109_46120 [Nostoc sp. HK-01]